MIPMQTTTVTVLRPSQGTDVDPYVTSDDSSDSTVVSNVPAHISAPKGNSTIIGGQQSDILFRLICDPADIEHTDRIYDEVTGLTYEIVWISTRNGLGISHVEADIRIVEGLSNG